MKRLILGVLAISLGASLAQAQTYKHRSDAPNVNFTVRHLGGKVTGHFRTNSLGTFVL